MKDIGKLRVSEILPELSQVADYHGLKINRAKDLKTTIFLFKNLYYNAPWEADETIDYEETKPIHIQGISLVTKRKPRRYISVVQKLKGLIMRRLFTK